MSGRCKPSSARVLAKQPGLLHACGTFAVLKGDDRPASLMVQLLAVTELRGVLAGEVQSLLAGPSREACFCI